jgi:hypothetical protein
MIVVRVVVEEIALRKPAEKVLELRIADPDIACARRFQEDVRKTFGGSAEQERVSSGRAPREVLGRCPCP